MLKIKAGTKCINCCEGYMINMLTQPCRCAVKGEICKPCKDAPLVCNFCHLTEDEFREMAYDSYKEMTLRAGEFKDKYETYKDMYKEYLEKYRGQLVVNMILLTAMLIFSIIKIIGNYG